MTYITFEQATKIAPHFLKSVLEPFVSFFNQYAESYGVTTPLRVAHFFAQAAHETDEFKTLEEYASGADYEGRTNLGNTQTGDGKRFKGRGGFQLTGRDNYARMSKILGLDLISHPELALTPEVSVRISLEYWKSRNLNDTADTDNIVTVTKKVNGGKNGLEHRKECLARAKEVLGITKPQVIVEDKTLYSVKDIQEKLISLGYKITADGDMGPKTIAAIRVFQKFNGLTIDGLAGPKTIKVLFT